MDKRALLMNYQLFHDITFNVLYGCIGLLVFVILERGIYLTFLGWRMQRLAADHRALPMNPAGKDIRALSVGGSGKPGSSCAMQKLLAGRS